MVNDQQQNGGTRGKGTVLVFGASGRQGGAAAAALKADGWSVRALVREVEIEQSERLAAAGIDVFTGAFPDLAAIENAMAGVDGVYSMQPNSGSAGSGITDEEEVRFGKAVADIALRTGVQHLVYASAGIISRGKTGLANLDTKIEIEDHVRSLNIPSTILRPATFMDLFTLPGMGLNAGSFSFFVHPDQHFQAIAVQDIGKIAARVFANPEIYAGRTIEIAGDELTGLELADALSAAAGCPIVYHRFPDALLADNEFLGRNAKLFEEGRASAMANISGLKSEFGELWSVADWLKGPGHGALKAAIDVEDQPVAMR